MKQNNMPETKRYAVVEESPMIAFDASRGGAYEIPLDMDIKSVGRFLIQNHGYEGIHRPTSYYTYRQKSFIDDTKERLEGKKTDLSQTFYIYKGYPVSGSVIHKFVERKNEVQILPYQKESFLDRVKRFFTG